MKNTEKYIPVSEYAKTAINKRNGTKGVSVQSIYQAIWRGDLKYRKLGNYTLVKVD